MTLETKTSPPMREKILEKLRRFIRPAEPDRESVEKIDNREYADESLEKHIK